MYENMLPLTNICIPVDEGCSTGWVPVLIYYRNAYRQISHNWGTAHTNDAAEK